MLKHSSDSSDYLHLVKEAQTLDASSCPASVKLALLGDFAAQPLIPLLKVLFFKNGIRLDVYAADYDAAELEALNPRSGLYSFQPEYIVILNSSQKLRERFYDAEDRSTFVDQTMARLSGLWRTLEKNLKAVIVQGNFVFPPERFFGNYESKIPESLGGAFQELNHRLREETRRTNRVLLLDVDHLASSLGRKDWFDERLWVIARSFCRPEHLPILAQGVADVVLAAGGRIVKCIVLDLDNILWGGVIADDELSGIRLGGMGEGEVFVSFQKFLRELRRRGIVLCVCSKNDRADALLPFHEHPDMVLREADITIFEANWRNKADNILHIQRALGIGLDSMVFLDDDPFERGLIRRLLPEVVVPELPEDPAEYARALSELNLFETASYTEEDRLRAERYRERVPREQLKERFTDLSEYLKSLRMRIKLERFNSFNLPRIAQLIQRSNQFNLTSRRHGESACESFMNDSAGYAPLTLSLSDRFGDSGLISVIVLKLLERAVKIDDYLMSCRVLQRGVENFAMNSIFELAANRGAEKVVGRYVKTEKNALVKDFYAGFGFQKTAEDKFGNSEWTLPVHRYEPREAFIASDKKVR